MNRLGSRRIGPAVVLALLGSAPVYGQTATPAPSGDTAAAPVKPTACIVDYPMEALRIGKMGTVTVAFRVRTDGHTDHIAVAASSGSDILDATTLRCAKSWLYRPATKSGQAVESTAAVPVAWQIKSAGESSAPTAKNALLPIPPTQDCLSRAAVTANRLAGKSGISVVRYRLTAGTVAAVTLKQSSGDEALDQEALSCVTGWRFEPQLAAPVLAVVAILANLQTERPPTDADVAKFIPKVVEAGKAAPVPPAEPGRPATGWSTAWIDWREAVQ